MAGMMVYDVLDILLQGGVSFDLSAFVGWAAAGASAAVGTVMGLRGLERAARKNALTGYSFYSFGLSLFVFILYLVL